MAKQTSYVPREEYTTPLDLAFAAVREVQYLQNECASASTKFPYEWMPKAQAFQKAAEDLGHVLHLLARLHEHVPKWAGHRCVRYEIQVPRRRNHEPARWSRAANMASAMRAVATDLAAAVVERGDQAGSGHVHLVEQLTQAAYELDAVTFPTMFGYVFPPSVVQRSGTDGPRTAPGPAS
jgi:hypothetical protein